MNAQPKGHAAPHPYQNTQAVNVTLRAMQIVRQQWKCGGCQQILRGKK